MDDKNFLDWEKKSPWLSYTKGCKTCQTYGGWNLLINAYRLPEGKENTPENRHLFCHFRAVCSHCYGRGYVDQNENCEGHNWEWVRNTGRCLNLYKCTKCGKHLEVDSGD